MRASGVVLALTLVLAVPPAAGGIGAAWADDPATPPSRTDVRDARDAVRDQARSVTTVQAELLAANQRLQETAVQAAQASEAWNGARYRLEQARREAAAAGDRAGIARDDVTTQRRAYTDAVVDSYQMAPELSAVVSIVQSDGIDAVVEQATTLSQTESAMETRYDGFRAASTLADVAHQQAADAEDEAARLQVEAREARDAAAAAADAAAQEADAIAAQKEGLIEELARLQNVSVELAEERQSALEAQALAEAAAERQAEQEAEAAGAGSGPAGSGRGRGGADAAAGRSHAGSRPRTGPAARSRAGPRTPARADPADAADTPRTLGRSRRGHRLRPRPAGRAVRVGRGRSQRLGLLGPDHGRLGRGRQVAAPLLGGAVRAVDPDLAEQPAAGRPGLLGLLEQRLVDLPRGALRRERPDHPRPAHRPTGGAGVDVLLDRAELLRPTLSPGAVPGQ